MAEVIGVISGVVTIGALAANTAMSVAKLKSYWNRLENAPADIQRLMDEVEILSLILDEIKDDQARNPISSLLLSNSSLSRCLDNCQKAAERLSSLTDEMGKSLETSGRLKKRWLSAKVVLKKDKLDVFKLELENAVRLLSLSHHSYTSALLRLPPDIVLRRFSETAAYGAYQTNLALDNDELNPSSLTSKSLSTVSKHIQPKISSAYYFWPTSRASGGFGSFSCIIQQSPREKHLGKKDSDNNEHWQIVASYRSPAWLVNKIWRFYATRSYNGWDFSIRQFNNVPGESPIFGYAKRGSVVGIQKLFNERLASPFDCDEIGHTALDYAVHYGRYFVCKLLIDHGSDVNDCAPGNWLAISHTFDSCGQKRIQEARDLSCLLLVKAEVDPDELKYYQGNTEGFVFWQQKIYPNYYDGPMVDRIRMAIKLALSSILEPKTFRRVLTKGEIPCSAVNLRDDRGKTLLHAVAGSIAKLQSSGGYNSEERDAYTIGWEAIIQELVAKGAYIHARTYASLTPLDSLLHRCFQFSHPTDSCRLHTVLKRWLIGLLKCGVDLSSYGKQEIDLHQEGEARWEFMVLEIKDDRGEVGEFFHVTSFSYGSSPDDWQIFLELSDEETDENPDQMAEIPGGWIEG